MHFHQVSNSYLLSFSVSCITATICLYGFYLATWKLLNRCRSSQLHAHSFFPKFVEIYGSMIFSQHSSKNQTKLIFHDYSLSLLDFFVFWITLQAQFLVTKIVIRVTEIIDDTPYVFTNHDCLIFRKISSYCL
ncbi:MAG: hypothetical protein FD122_3708 [Stygiobacter sp.]|nr:MAG: hypothetical protein FD122_3708 [Stygiobacter sp.]